MAGTRTEMVDGVRITVVEDTREDLQDFLGTAQEIESLEGEEQKEKLEEIFGKEEEEDQDEKKKGEKAEEPEKNQEEETSPRQSSRANTDVVLAMQIADQAAAEAAAETAMWFMERKCCVPWAPERPAWWCRWTMERCWKEIRR